MASGDSNGFGERFGENLRRARRDAGLSQEETAVRASLHRTEIGLLERGERTPRLDTAVKLARATGVRVEELLVGIDWEPPALPTYWGEFKVEPS